MASMMEDVSWGSLREQRNPALLQRLVNGWSFLRPDQDPSAEAQLQPRLPLTTLQEGTSWWLGRVLLLSFLERQLGWHLALRLGTLWIVQPLVR